MTATEQAQTAKSLRPLVILMASANLAIAALLITTASLGASPIGNSAYEIAVR